MPDQRSNPIFLANVKNLSLEAISIDSEEISIRRYRGDVDSVVKVKLPLGSHRLYIIQLYLAIIAGSKQFCGIMSLSLCDQLQIVYYHSFSCCDSKGFVHVSLLTLLINVELPLLRSKADQVFAHIESRHRESWIFFSDYNLRFLLASCIVMNDSLVYCEIYVEGRDCLDISEQLEVARGNPRISLCESVLVVSPLAVNVIVYLGLCNISAEERRLVAEAEEILYSPFSVLVPGDPIR